MTTCCIFLFKGFYRIHLSHSGKRGREGFSVHDSIADPTGELRLDVRTEVALVEQQDGRVVVAMSDCATNALVHGFHAQVLVVHLAWAATICFRLKTSKSIKTLHYGLSLFF